VSEHLIPRGSGRTTSICAEPSRPHVLIIDDHDASRTVCANYCDLFDHTSETARSGDEALEALNRRRFDLVVMSVELAGAAALDALQAIRSLPHPAAATPVIGLAAPDRDEAQRWLAAGLSSVIAKPVTAARLFAAMQSALTPPPASPRSWAPAI